MTDAFATDLLSFALPVQVVVDGAIVPDIEKHLERHKIQGRPLFRDTMDRETVIAGPWLISPGLSHLALERSIAASREAGQGVFWLGDQGDGALYRHLRKLGSARMPDGRIVYFRYYDSEVLAAIVPLADPVQAAHIFGPTQVIALLGGSSDGATVERPECLPDGLPGPIAFEQWQIDVLDERQRIMSRQNIGHLLRREYPDKTSHLNSDELYGKVLAYERDGQTLNLTSEEALANWARLNVSTDDAASRSAQLRRDVQKIPIENVNRIFSDATPDLIRNNKPET